MRLNQPDIVVVGGGIAGASIATVLARGGTRVLLLERQRAYRDRIRGEYMAPWGVLEARALGLEHVIRSTRAVDARYSVGYDELVDPSAAEAGKRDNSTIFPGVPGGLCASHPKACQALADDAARAGVEVISGAAEVRVQPGKRPTVTYRDGRETEVRPRLVIGADGRSSTVRKQAAIRMNQIPATHMAAGLLVEGAGKWPEDQYTIGVEGDCMFFVFPQGDGRLRLYICHAKEQATRWAGRAGARRFIEAFGRLRAIPESLGLGLVTPAGPCGTFGGDQTWCDQPFADGVVLAGDAGGYDNPVDGQGLSLALRDARALSDLLLSSSDWTTTGLRPYAEQRGERLRRMRRVSTTYAAFMTTFTDVGRTRRARLYGASRDGAGDLRLALSAIFVGPDRLPAAAFTDQLHDAVLA